MLSFLFWILFVHLQITFADYITTTSIPWTAPMSWNCTDSGKLQMETAKIIFNFMNISNIYDPIYIYGVSDNCYHCLHLPLSLIPLQSNKPVCIIIDSHHSYSIGFSTIQPFDGCKNKNKTCAWQPNRQQYMQQPFSYHYNEYSHYNININATKTIIIKTKSSSDKYIPLYITLGVITFYILCYNLYLYFRSFKHNVIDLTQFNDIQYEIIEIKDKPENHKRFICVDAFRGLSLIIMIFVNYGGGGYWFFNHSTWNGLTIADLVFPWFIFIMGVAMAITFPRYLKTYDRYFIIRRVIIRGIKLFLIAYISCNNAYYLQYIRIMGVLQYFVMAYTFNGLLLAITEPQNIPRVKRSNFLINIPEIIIYWKQWIVVLSLLFINLMIVFLLPVTIYGQKCRNGYMGAGGIGDYGKHIECTGGAHRYIDYKLFGHKHVYQHPTCAKYYQTGWYEAESFIGGATCILLCYFGIYIGRIFYIYKTHKQRIIRWIINCFIFGLIAGCLCQFKQNGGVIPVNKNLWSLSFICCQASTGILVLLIFYILIDVFGIWSGLPFHYLGKNSIVIYVGSEIMSKYFPFGFEYGEQNHYKLLLSNIIGVLSWICIAIYLFQKKIHFAL